MKGNVLGLDLAKDVFHLVILTGDGKELRRLTLRRTKLLAYLLKADVECIAMEACSGAHHWARVLERHGCTVKLLPPQHVKGYLRGQKNDFNDARAIGEACLHGSVRPVKVKTLAEQEIQSFHRIREQLLTERTRMVNQLRGLLSEYGIVVRQGIAPLRTRLPDILEDAENDLGSMLRAILRRQTDRLTSLCEEIDWYDAQLKRQVNQSDVCERLMEAPAIGPVVSSKLFVWLGDGSQFKRGRDASAALGVVPKQHSSGGKVVLKGITKRGDKSLRAALIHGARAVVTQARKSHKHDKLSRWLRDLEQRRGFNKAVVALANKLVRIAWVIVARGERYRPA